MKKIISILLVLATVISMCACTSKKDGDEDTIEDDGIKHKATDVALSTENFSCSRAEVSYVFYRNYNDFRYNQSESFDMYNIDPETSLKKQEYHDGITWFDTIMEESIAYLSELLVCCEAAKAAGVTIGEEEQAEIDEAIKSWKDYASNYDYTIEELLALQYNSDVTLRTMEDFMEKDLLARKYSAQLVEGYSFTEDEMKAFVKENSDRFYSINYISYKFDEDLDETAKVSAEELAKITDAEQFKAYIEKYMEEKLVLDKRVPIKECVYNYIAYNENSKFSKWAFGDEAAANTVFTDFNDVDGEYRVYLLTATPSLQEYNTRHARIVKINVSDHNTYQATLAEANKLLEEWKNGEATEESFAALAEKKSSDSSSASAGGLYESISRGDDTLDDSIKDWIFDEAKTAGETAVVRGEVSYCIIYYVGEGEVQWKYLANKGMSSEKYNKDMKSVQEKHKVTENKNVINSVDA